VDDEPTLVRIATRIFEQLGYRVTAHMQAADALAAVTTNPDDFDLIFTDLTMPRMTGLELARQITALRPGLPVVLTSGYSGALEVEEMRGAGIREVVGKPFLAQTIAEVVDRVLRAH
jgi:CheY-like chemotaxis protein